MFENIEEVAEILQNKELFREYCKIFLQNFDIITVRSGLIDKDLFDKINHIMESAFKVNKMELNKALRSFVQNIETKYSLEKLTLNLLLFQKEYPKFYTLFKETPLNELEKQFE